MWFLPNEGSAGRESSMQMSRMLGFTGALSVLLGKGGGYRYYKQRE